MHAISSYRGNRPTNKQTRRPPARPLQTRTQTGPITIHCAAKLSAQCKNCPVQLQAAKYTPRGRTASTGAHTSVNLRHRDLVIRRSDESGENTGLEDDGSNSGL